MNSRGAPGDGEERRQATDVGERAQRGTVAGNEEADRMTRRTGWIGAWIPEPEIATPAGIKQASLLFAWPAHLKWDREAARGLTYVETDRGPLERWLWE